MLIDPNNFLPHVVIVSARAARLKFQGCSPDYIANVCHGRCCWVQNGKQSSTTVYAEPDQRVALTVRGVKIGKDGVLKTRKDGKCFFQNEVGHCGVHFEQNKGQQVKPRSCSISPWMLTKNGRLIIRNRYTLLRCYRAEPALPAYTAFRAGLVLLFGEDKAKEMVDHFENGGGDFRAEISEERYELMHHVSGVWKKVSGRG